MQAAKIKLKKRNKSIKKQVLCWIAGFALHYLGLWRWIKRRWKSRC